MDRPKEVKARPIDHDKSERQLKGLDGDALAEMDEMATRHPHDEIFEAHANAKRPRDEDEEG